MPTLFLRTVGMSYLIEGIASSTLDAERFQAAMTTRYGPATAMMSTPRSLELTSPDRPAPIDAMILDRKAEDQDSLMAWIARHVSDHGYSYAQWVHDGRDSSTATLHFHA